MFQRIINVIKGWFGLQVSDLERANPEALIELEKENLRSQISRYNEGLASHAALSEKLMSQIRRLEKEERTLKAKITAHLKAGNREHAGRYAVRYQEVKRGLDENRLQLEDAEKTYKNLTRARDVSVKAAQEKIASIKQGLTDMRIKQATAELTEMASGMINQIGGAGDTLNRLEEMIEEERATAAGRARVARDSLDMAEVDLAETEADALADAALADFAAAEGIALEGDAPLPAAADDALAEFEKEEDGKSMGPVAEGA